MEEEDLEVPEWYYRKLAEDRLRRGSYKCIRVVLDESGQEAPGGLGGGQI